MAAMWNAKPASARSWAAALLVLIVAVAAVGLYERYWGDDAARSGAASLEDRVDHFDSFADAEERTGYRILRPSEQSTLLGGVTYVEEGLIGELPTSVSHYVSSDGTELSFRMLPHAPARSPEAPDTTVGSKEGWSYPSGNGHTFLWKCGSKGSYFLACMASTEGSTSGKAVFETFVRGLQ
jgi:hypothetical protein